MGDTFYRIAETKHTVGQVFKGRGVRPLADRFHQVEEIFERRRPPGKLDRGDCVYVRDKIDFERVGITYSQGFIHTIKPIGDFERRDLRWTGILQMRHIRDERLRKGHAPGLTDEEIADRWWRGEASNEPDWEWVGKEAQIVAVETDPIVVSSNPWLAMFDWQGAAP